uniref:UspA domain-containing protein n=1 Tax=Cannabis sativa TaxID=3483 RepID=A0A803P4H4_CANSA
MVVLQTKVEIIVTEGDQEGRKISAMVREIGASAIVLGLHDHSFLYKLALAHNDITKSFSCRVLAIRQPPSSASGRKTRARASTTASLALDNSISMDFSQIDISGVLRLPDLPPPKIPYRICPSPSAIIWRSRKSRRK